MGVRALDTHHKNVDWSVLGLITDLIDRALGRYKSCLPAKVLKHVDRKCKAAYYLIPISFNRPKYVPLIVIASDSKHPWSPKEMYERVMNIVFRRFDKWLRSVLGKYAYMFLCRGTVMFIGALSRGCYIKKDVYYLDRTEILALVTRDIRRIVRWLRSWNPKKIAEVFESVEEALEEFAWRLAREVKPLFNMIRNMFEKSAERLKNKSEQKGVKPYGELKELINRLRALSSAFEDLVMYADGKLTTL